MINFRFESIEEDCNKSLVIKTPSNQNVKKAPGSLATAGKSIPTLRPKQPPKKRDTIRRLVQQKTLRCQLQDHLQTTNGNSPVTTKPAPATWRKPPKKQSTIRRMVRRESTIRQIKANEQTTPVKRKTTLTQKSAPPARTKTLPKRQLLPQPPGSSSRILTRQSSRQNPPTNPEADDRPRTLGTLTFIERSSTVPFDVEILQSSENNSSLLKSTEKTVIVKCDKAKEQNGGETTDIDNNRTELDNDKTELDNNAGQLNDDKTELNNDKVQLEIAKPELKSASSSMPVLSREETVKVNFNKPALKSAPSLTVGEGDAYIPAASSWPMQLVSP